MNRIKELRLSRGWNQDILGDKLNVKRAAISKYETGKIPLTDETLIKLCEIFDTTADYILGMKDERDTKKELPCKKEALRIYNELIRIGIASPDEALDEAIYNRLVRFIENNKDFILESLKKQ